MKIAVASKGTELNSLSDDRFGRCENFIIYNTEDKTFTAIENEAKNEGSGAGGKAVRDLYRHKVDIIITPELGPKATEALRAFEIKAYKTDNSLTVEELLKSFSEGRLKEIEISTVAEHSGLRRV